MRHAHLALLVALLSALALGLFAYKSIALEFPLTANQSAHTWRVEARLRGEAGDKPMMVRFHLPRSGGRFGVVDERIYGENVDITTSEDEHGERTVTWSAERAEGRKTLYYQADIYRFDRDIETSPPPPDAFLAYEHLLEDWSDEERTALDELAGIIRERSMDVYQFWSAALDEVTNDELLPSEEVLIGDREGGISHARQAFGMMLLLRMQGVPARSVHGIDLARDTRRARLRHWVEVWEEGHWQPYSVEFASRGVPDTYLPWWRDVERPTLVRGLKLGRIVYSVTREVRPQVAGALALAEIVENPVFDFTLFSLPVETQQVYRVMLMVPIGALVLIVLRQLIGLRTFGTFMPVLIALAFRETQLVNGILMFSVLVAVGLLFRFYFERLKLLSVPRLSAVMIVVVLLMVAFSAVLDHVEVGAGISVALFPMVILTMVIERMSVVWEEYGPKESLKRGLNSLLAAVLAYLVMTLDSLEFLIFVYPELLLLVLALALAMGRYTGYRLLELYRFRSLVDAPGGDGR